MDLGKNHTISNTKIDRTCNVELCMTGFKKNLFNKKTLQNASSDINISEKIRFAENWLNLLESGKLKKEKPNYLNFENIILKEILDYTNDDIAFEEDNVEFQLKDNGGVKTTCIELKGSDVDLHNYHQYEKGRKEVPVLQTWGYMSRRTIKYGICSNYNQFILITKDGLDVEYVFDFEQIRGNPNKLKEFIYVFSKKNLIDDGKVKELVRESEREQDSISDEFYTLFHRTRGLLIRAFESNSKMTREHSIFYSQTMLNRLIFIFFVVDMGVVPNNMLFQDRIKRTQREGGFNENSRNICNTIKGLFVDFDRGSRIDGISSFNGSFFSGEIPDGAYFTDMVDGETNPIVELLLKMNNYDFKTAIDVTILGHIFEQSISDLEKIKTGNVDLARKKDGIYYTPAYITNYICKNTIIPYLSKTGTESITHLIMEYDGEYDVLMEKIKQLRIVDMACGSGAFLIKAVDILMTVMKRIRQKVSSSSLSSTLSDFWEEDTMRDIITTNIYGVDLNRESAEITKLSLFLKMVSNRKPLVDLSGNIKSGNSVIRDSKENGFNWKSRFSGIFDSTNPGFDIIIGNPPYVRQENLKDLKKHMQLPAGHALSVGDNPEKSFTISSKTDLSGYFFYHALDILKNGGLQGIISSASWMDFGYGREIKDLFLRNCNIKQMLQTNFKIFRDADVKTVTIILEKSKPDTPEKVLLSNVNEKESINGKTFVTTEKNQDEFRNSDNWNSYFSQIDVTPKIEMKKMQDVVTVKFGKKTGNNTFFVLSESIINQYGLAEKYYVPVVSGNIKSIDLNGVSPTSYLLSVNESKGELTKTEEGRKVLHYINEKNSEEIVPKKGIITKKRKISDLSSVSGKRLWYSLGLDQVAPPPIILARFAHGRMKIYENNGKFYSRDNCVWITLDDPEHSEALLAYLSSSYFTLMSERRGHTQAGKSGSALQLLTKDWKEISVPDFQKYKKCRNQMKVAWNKYKNNLDLDLLDTTVIKNLFEVNDPEHIAAIKRIIRQEIMVLIQKRGRLDAYKKEMKELGVELDETGDIEL